MECLQVQAIDIFIFAEIQPYTTIKMRFIWINMVNNSEIYALANMVNSLFVFILFIAPRNGSLGGSLPQDVKNMTYLLSSASV